MLESKYTVQCPRLILGEDEESRDLFDHCSGELRRRLYGLPDGGTLLLDLKKVLVSDENFMFDMVAILQSASGGLLQGKHFLLLEPKDRVLRVLINVLDMVSECAMVLDHKGAIKPIGYSLNTTLLKTLHAVFNADSKNEMVSAADLRKYDASLTTQVYADSLRRLYHWGFLDRQEQPGNRGRPLVRYCPFWPLNEKLWPTSEVYWEIPSLKSNDDPKQFYFPGTHEEYRDAS